MYQMIDECQNMKNCHCILFNLVADYYKLCEHNNILFFFHNAYDSNTVQWMYYLNRISSGFGSLIYVE